MLQLQRALAMRVANVDLCMLHYSTSKSQLYQTGCNAKRSAGDFAAFVQQPHNDTLTYQSALSASAY
jgi:hypothetical protein